MQESRAAEASNTDDVGQDEFPRYCAVLARHLSQGHDVMQHEISRFLEGQSQLLQDCSTVKSNFAPFEFRSGRTDLPEIDCILVEIVLEKKPGGIFRVTHQSNVSTVDRNADVPPLPLPHSARTSAEHRRLYSPEQDARTRRQLLAYDQQQDIEDRCARTCWTSLPQLGGGSTASSSPQRLRNVNELHPTQQDLLAQRRRNDGKLQQLQERHSGDPMQELQQQIRQQQWMQQQQRLVELAAKTNGSGSARGRVPAGPDSPTRSVGGHAGTGSCSSLPRPPLDRCFEAFAAGQPAGSAVPAAARSCSVPPVASAYAYSAVGVYPHSGWDLTPLPPLPPVPAELASRLDALETKSALRLQQIQAELGSSEAKSQIEATRAEWREKLLEVEVRAEMREAQAVARRAADQVDQHFKEETDRLRQEILDIKAARDEDARRAREAEDTAKTTEALRADIEALQAQHREKLTHAVKTRELELHEEHGQRHEELQNAIEKLRADAEQFERDKQAQQIAIEAERQAHEETLARHQVTEAALERLKGHADDLRKDKDAESESRQEFERRHQAVTDEQQKMHVDHAKLNQLMQAEREAREESESRHRDVEADLQRLHKDRTDLEASKNAEKLAREDLERRHQNVVAESQALREDMERLRLSKESEELARNEADTRYREVLAEAERLRNEKRELLDCSAEGQRTTEDLRRRIDTVEAAKSQMSSDLEQAKASKDALQRAREEAEQRAQSAEQALLQLRADHDHMHARKSRGLEDSQQELEKARSALDEEKRMREDFERNQALASDQKQALLEDKMTQMMELETMKLHNELQSERRLRDGAENVASSRLEEVRKMEEVIRNLRSTSGQADADLQAIARERSALEDRSRQEKNRLSDELVMVRERFSVDAEELQRSNAELESDREQLQVDYNSLKSKLEASDRRVKDLQRLHTTEVDKKQVEYDALMARRRLSVDNNMAELDKIESTRAQLQGQLNRRDTEIQDLQGRYSDLQSTHERLEAEHINARREIEQERIELRLTAERALQDASNVSQNGGIAMEDKHQLEADNKALRRAVDSRLEAESELRKTIEDQDRDVLQKIRQAEDYRTELDAERRERERLEGLLRNSQGKRDSSTPILTDFMRRSSQGKRDSSTPIMTDLGQVTPSYSTTADNIGEVDLDESDGDEDSGEGGEMVSLYSQPLDSFPARRFGSAATLGRSGGNDLARSSLAAPRLQALQGRHTVQSMQRPELNEVNLLEDDESSEGEA